jgi:tellurite resistance protein TerC
MFITMSIPFMSGFLVFIAAMLAIDLGLLRRGKSDVHVVSVKEALTWSAIWVGLAIAFNVCIYFFWDVMAPHSTHSSGDAAMTFLAGYLLEESLSVDNVFVFALIFSYFKVDHKYQHRVLFWGVVGAVVMRGIIICLGAALVSRFEWILYIFGVILLFSGIKLVTGKDEAPHPEKNPVVRLARKFLPVAPDYDEHHFLTRKWEGRQMVTPLFIVLLVVETSDLIFASDSLPAIFAVTQDPTLIFTSNVFAILGLRSMYFVLADMIERFRYLNVGLSIVLIFIGLKLLVKHWVDIPIGASLAFIAVALGTSVAVSLMRPVPAKDKPEA